MPVRLYDREEVRRMVEVGARLVEVLEKEEYEELHPAGAVSLPLWEIDERATRELDPDRAVIVYCNDFL